VGPGGRWVDVYEGGRPLGDGVDQGVLGFVGDAVGFVKPCAGVDVEFGVGVQAVPYIAVATMASASSGVNPPCPVAIRYTAAPKMRSSATSGPRGRRWDPVHRGRQLAHMLDSD